MLGSVARNNPPAMSKPYGLPYFETEWTFENGEVAQVDVYVDYIRVAVLELDDAWVHSAYSSETGERVSEIEQLRINEDEAARQSCFEVAREDLIQRI